MIEGIFETHIRVKNLDTSIGFYQRLPGLEMGVVDRNRGAAFFWAGGRGRSMLGLWRTVEEIQPQHFAFRVSPDAMNGPVLDFLRTWNLTPYNFLNDGSGEPMVFAWMPAISIYFRDPDNHELEFIAMLDGEPRPECGIVSLEEWQRIHQARGAV